MRALPLTVVVVLLSGCGPAAQPDAGSGGGAATGGGATAGGGGSTGGGGGSIGGGGGATGGGGGSVVGGGGGSTGGGTGTPDGGPVQCTTAATCAPEDGGAFACDGRSMSCIDGLCLPECGAPRTCTLDTATSCRTCAAVRTCSTFNACIGGPGGDWRVHAASCAEWTDGGSFVGSTVSLINAGCTATFRRGDAGAEGRVTLLDDFTLLAALPAFGGGCTVLDVAGPDGGLAFSCPRCEFLLQRN